VNDLDAPVFLGYRLKGPPINGVPKLRPIVTDICSMSDCIRGRPEGAHLSWAGFNSACCYNTIQDAMATLPNPRPPFELFGFSLLPAIFGGDGSVERFDFQRLRGCDWESFPLEDPGFESLGVDVVSFTSFRPATAQYAPVLASFDCSPLSCNGLAHEYPVNPYCLLEVPIGIGAAKEMHTKRAERGPYVVVDVLRALWKEG
jgi:hypothetical protein